MADRRVSYDQPAEGVARITLTRADKANAQDKAVRCILLAAEGEHFSSGHDLKDDRALADFASVTQWAGFDAPGQAGQMAAEHEMYLGLCWRWRNLPKPVVVQVQGLCMAGGLTLVWPFDIVIASEDAVFSDPTVAFGVNGVEYFAHVWELGHRKARELLYTGCDLSAEDAKMLGMVNHVVPRADLEARTLAMAARIAKRPMMGLRLAKLACNQSQDAQGFGNALHGIMGWQQVGHAQARLEHGMPIDPAGADLIKQDRKR